MQRLTARLTAQLDGSVIVQPYKVIAMWTASEWSLERQIYTLHTRYARAIGSFGKAQRIKETGCGSTCRCLSQTMLAPLVIGFGESDVGIRGVDSPEKLRCRSTLD